MAKISYRATVDWSGQTHLFEVLVKKSKKTSIDLEKVTQVAKAALQRIPNRTNITHLEISESENKVRIKDKASVQAQTYSLKDFLTTSSTSSDLELTLVKSLSLNLTASNSTRLAFLKAYIVDTVKSFSLIDLFFLYFTKTVGIPLAYRFLGGITVSFHLMLSTLNLLADCFKKVYCFIKTPFLDLKKEFVDHLFKNGKAPLKLTDAIDSVVAFLKDKKNEMPELQPLIAEYQHCSYVSKELAVIDSINYLPRQITKTERLARRQTQLLQKLKVNERLLLPGGLFKSQACKPLLYEFTRISDQKFKLRIINLTCPLPEYQAVDATGEKWNPSLEVELDQKKVCDAKHFIQPLLELQLAAANRTPYKTEDTAAMFLPGGNPHHAAASAINRAVNVHQLLPGDDAAIDELSIDSSDKQKAFKHHWALKNVFKTAPLVSAFISSSSQSTNSTPLQETDFSALETVVTEIQSLLSRPLPPLEPNDITATKKIDNYSTSLKTVWTLLKTHFPDDAERLKLEMEYNFLKRLFLNKKGLLKTIKGKAARDEIVQYSRLWTNRFLKRSEKLFPQDSIREKEFEGMRKEIELITTSIQEFERKLAQDAQVISLPHKLKTLLKVKLPSFSLLTSKKVTLSTPINLPPLSLPAIDWNQDIQTTLPLFEQAVQSISKMHEVKSMDKWKPLESATLQILSSMPLDLYAESALSPDELTRLSKSIASLRHILWQSNHMLDQAAPTLVHVSAFYTSFVNIALLAKRNAHKNFLGNFSFSKNYFDFENTFHQSLDTSLYSCNPTEHQRIAKARRLLHNSLAKNGEITHVDVLNFPIANGTIRESIIPFLKRNLEEVKKTRQVPITDLGNLQTRQYEVELKKGKIREPKEALHLRRELTEIQSDLGEKGYLHSQVNDLRLALLQNKTIFTNHKCYLETGMLSWTKAHLEYIATYFKGRNYPPYIQKAIKSTMVDESMRRKVSQLFRKNPQEPHFSFRREPNRQNILDRIHIANIVYSTSILVFIVIQHAILTGPKNYLLSLSFIIDLIAISIIQLYNYAVKKFINSVIYQYEHHGAEIRLAPYDLTFENSYYGNETTNLTFTWKRSQGGKHPVSPADFLTSSAAFPKLEEAVPHLIPAGSPSLKVERSEETAFLKNVRSIHREEYKAELKALRLSEDALGMPRELASSFKYALSQVHGGSHLLNFFTANPEAMKYPAAQRLLFTRLFCPQSDPGLMDYLFRKNLASQITDFLRKQSLLAKQKGDAETLLFLAEFACLFSAHTQAQPVDGEEYYIPTSRISFASPAHQADPQVRNCLYYFSELEEELKHSSTLAKDLENYCHKELLSNHPNFMRFEREIHVQHLALYSIFNQELTPSSLPHLFASARLVLDEDQGTLSINPHLEERASSTIRRLQENIPSLLQNTALRNEILTSIARDHLKEDLNSLSWSQDSQNPCRFTAGEYTLDFMTGFLGKNGRAHTLLPSHIASHPAIEGLLHKKATSAIVDPCTIEGKEGKKYELQVNGKNVNIFYVYGQELLVQQEINGKIYQWIDLSNAKEGLSKKAKDGSAWIEVKDGYFANKELLIFSDSELCYRGHVQYGKIKNLVEVDHHHESHLLKFWNHAAFKPLAMIEDTDQIEAKGNASGEIQEISYLRYGETYGVTHQGKKCGIYDKRDPHFLLANQNAISIKGLGGAFQRYHVFQHETLKTYTVAIPTYDVQTDSKIIELKKTLEASQEVNNLKGILRLALSAFPNYLKSQLSAFTSAFTSDSPEEVQPKEYFYSLPEQPELISFHYNSYTQRLEVKEKEDKKAYFYLAYLMLVHKNYEEAAYYLEQAKTSLALVDHDDSNAEFILHYIDLIKQWDDRSIEAEALKFKLDIHFLDNQLRVLGKSMDLKQEPYKKAAIFTAMLQLQDQAARYHEVELKLPFALKISQSEEKTLLEVVSKGAFLSKQERKKKEPPKPRKSAKQILPKILERTQRKDSLSSFVKQLYLCLETKHAAKISSKDPHFITGNFHDVIRNFERYFKEAIEVRNDSAKKEQFLQKLRLIQDQDEDIQTAVWCLASLTQLDSIEGMAWPKISFEYKFQNTSSREPNDSSSSQGQKWFQKSGAWLKQKATPYWLYFKSIGADPAAMPNIHEKKSLESLFKLVDQIDQKASEQHLDVVIAIDPVISESERDDLLSLPAWERAVEQAKNELETSFAGVILPVEKLRQYVEVIASNIHTRSHLAGKLNPSLLTTEDLATHPLLKPLLSTLSPALYPLYLKLADEEEVINAYPVSERKDIAAGILLNEINRAPYPEQIKLVLKVYLNEVTNGLLTSLNHKNPAKLQTRYKQQLEKENQELESLHKELNDLESHLNTLIQRTIPNWEAIYKTRNVSLSEEEWAALSKELQSEASTWIHGKPFKEDLERFTLDFIHDRLQLFLVKGPLTDGSNPFLFNEVRSQHLIELSATVKTISQEDASQVFSNIETRWKEGRDALSPYEKRIFDRYQGSLEAYLEEIKSSKLFSLTSNTTDLTKAFSKIADQEEQIANQLRDDVVHQVNTASKNPLIQSQKKLEKLAGKLKEITFEEITLLWLQGDLQKLLQWQPELTKKDIETIEVKVTHYFLHDTKRQQAKKGYLASLEREKSTSPEKKKAQEDVIVDILNAKRVYKLDFTKKYNRACLLIEHAKGYVLRKDQVDIFGEIVRDPTKAKQLIMGAGKTDIGNIVLLFGLASGHNLVTWIGPDALFNENSAYFDFFSRAYFGQAPVQFRFDRNMPLEGATLETLYHNLLLARRNRSFVMTTKEDIECLELKWLKLLDDLDLAKTPEEKEKLIQEEKLLLKIHNLFSESGYALIDELDTVQRANKQFIFETETGRTLSKEPLKIEIAQAVFSFIFSSPKWKNSIKIRQNMQHNLSQIQVDDLRKDLASMFVETWHEDPALNLGFAELSSLKDYLLGEAAAMPECLIQSPLLKRKAGLAKELITPVLPAVLKGKGNVTYGFDLDDKGQRLEEIIPYASCGVPNTGNVHGNLVERICCQYLGYIQTEVSFEQVKNRYEQLKKGALERHLEETLAPNSTPEELAWQEMHWRISPNEEAPSLLEVTEGDLRKICVEMNRPVSDGEFEMSMVEFVSKHVLPNLKVSGETLESNAQNFSSQFKFLTGFSGTIGSVSTFSDKMQDPDQAYNLTTDGKTIAALLYKTQNGKSPIATYKAVSREERMQEIYKYCTEKKANFLIDAGSSLDCCRSTEEFAKFMLERFVEDDKPFDGVIYFNHENRWTVIRKDKKEPESVSSIAHINPKRFFTIYDHAHRVGAHRDQAPDAHFVITGDKHTTIEDYLQSYARARKGWTGGQIPHPLISEETKKSIQAEGDLLFETYLGHLIEIEATEEAKYNLLAAKQKLTNIRRFALIQCIKREPNADKRAFFIFRLRNYLFSNPKPKIIGFDPDDPSLSDTQKRRDYERMQNERLEKEEAFLAELEKEIPTLDMLNKLKDSLTNDIEELEKELNLLDMLNKLTDGSANNVEEIERLSPPFFDIFSQAKKDLQNTIQRLHHQIETGYFTEMAQEKETSQGREKQAQVEVQAETQVEVAVEVAVEVEANKKVSRRQPQFPAEPRIKFLPNNLSWSSTETTTLREIVGKTLHIPQEIFISSNVRQELDGRPVNYFDQTEYKPLTDLVIVYEDVNDYSEDVIDLNSQIPPTPKIIMVSPSDRDAYLAQITEGKWRSNLYIDPKIDRDPFVSSLSDYSIARTCVETGNRYRHHRGGVDSLYSISKAKFAIYSLDANAITFQTYPLTQEERESPELIKNIAIAKFMAGCTEFKGKDLSRTPGAKTNEFTELVKWLQSDPEGFYQLYKRLAKTNPQRAKKRPKSDIERAFQIVFSS